MGSELPLSVGGGAAPTERSLAAAHTLAETFVSLADSLVAEYDAADLLERLANTCVTVLGVSAAGIVVHEPDEGLQALASSTESSRLLELFEVQRNEGPCLDAFRGRQVVVSSDLRADTERWPHFAPLARRFGYHAVTALPLRVRDHAVGALNLFLAEPGVLSAPDQRMAQALADVAAIGMVQRRASGERETLVAQLQRALDSRVVIEQAKGLLAQAHGVGVDEAFAALRRYARSRNLKLSVTAADVVAGRISAEHIHVDRARTPPPARP